jgi:hypothetical protein
VRQKEVRGKKNEAMSIRATEKDSCREFTRKNREVLLRFVTDVTSADAES